jgi:hypothetical protein
MSANLNPHVIDLLSWHGHAAGGVHVPFQARANPLGQVIVTSLVTKLRTLASQIAGNPDSRPRWIFLVGGPGNGKSETVQDFLEQLDSSLAIGGALVQALRLKYSCAGLLPRKVEILPNDLVSGVAAFTANVGRLMVIQDATATESAMGNAARELADDLADLLTCPATPPVPVFVACANRGLLARTMNEAVRGFGPNNEVTTLLASVIQASSLGLETLARRKQCWPLETDERFACWPLDVESLASNDTTPSPLDVIVRTAAELARWETAGRCQDCTARDLCPFRQSAEWLRDNTIRANLLALLRRGELARGQRWNFRDAFSLVAELLVGQWSDFEPADHPCRWVHQHHAGAGTSPPDTNSALALATHLYPSAMFKGGHPRHAAATFLETRPITPQSQPLTHSLVSGAAAISEYASAKPIREMLARDYLRLDPATSTPSDPTHPLRLIEDAFCQSVEQGRSELRCHAIPARAEDALLELLERAEAEWDLLGRESATAVAAVCLLRKIAGMIAKRSAGLRLGYHALDEYLADYEASLRDASRLSSIRVALQALLGDTVPRFNLLEILGQPTAERQPLVSLQGSPPGIRPVLAPVATASTPGHDLPCIVFTNPAYRIPLTFDFFMALRLRKEGCAGSSLPASVRAALDRTRHRFAGELCRQDDLFVDGRASIVLATGQRITLPSAGRAPALVTD